MPISAWRAWETVSGTAIALPCLAMHQECRDRALAPPADSPAHACNSLNTAAALRHDPAHLAPGHDPTAAECTHPGRAENQERLTRLKDERKS